MFICYDICLTLLILLGFRKVTELMLRIFLQKKTHCLLFYML
jgi:hypothetical protein